MEKEKEFRQFHELTECELNDLRQALWERAVKEKRDLLWDVRCVYEPDEIKKE